MTQRRTTKLTSRPISPDAPYVAIELKSVDPTCTRIECYALHDMRLTDHRGAAFVDIKENQVYDLVRSESLGNNLFYIVTEERCYCPATTPHCKHRRPMFAAQPEQIAAAPIIDEPTQPVAEAKGTSTGDASRRDNGARGTLHNSARGSFLDQCFGTSAASAKYRQAYIDSKRSSL